MYLPILILPIIVSFCNIGAIVAQTNTLHQPDTLTSTNRLVSNKNNFTLGFIKPFTDDYNNNNTYLAIWDPASIIWIANRDTPIINGSSPTLFIDNTGKLVINQTGGLPIQLCPTQQTTTITNKSNIKAILLDSGNLVLTQGHSNGSSVGDDILWQSFDCPTDTLLPGMKLGINHRTGRNWTLTSWLAADDPSQGAFTLEWDPHGLQLVLKRRGDLFWKSGALTNLNDDRDILPVTLQNLLSFNMTYTKNSDEESLSYTLKQEPMDPTDYDSKKWNIDYEGGFNPGSGVELQTYCYGYKIEEEGCAEWRQPQCRTNDTLFKLISGNFINKTDENNINILEGESVSPADCRVKCWNDCNCQGYQNTGTLNCILYYQDAEFEPDESGASDQYYVIQRLPNKNNTKNEGTVAERKTTKIKINREWIAIISAMMSVLLLSVLVLVIIFYCRWRRKGAKKEKNLLQFMITTDTIHNANELESDHEFAQNLKVFSFVSIIEATNNFSVENKLGRGGFGSVYKGKLPEGKEIAVKRLSRSSRQGLVEFKNELILIAKLQHKNLVRLIGCCIHNEEKLLIYEYMPNKSLDSFLFDVLKRAALNWSMRVKIIEGISQGLLYLHQHSRLRIIHRDMKVSNILLDEDMNPKISDFGMARIFKQNEFIANTCNPVGTYGYMSPEYAMDGIFSVKSDIFSFGVIILEILSGRRNNSFYQQVNNEPLNLIGYTWELWGKGAGLELMDPTLSDSCSNQQFLRFIQIGLLCVEESPSNRPAISEVIFMITNENTILPMVKKPAFTNLEKHTHAYPQTDHDMENNSINIMSTSTMTGR